MTIQVTEITPAHLAYLVVYFAVGAAIVRSVNKALDALAVEIEKRHLRSTMITVGLWTLVTFGFALWFAVQQVSGLSAFIISVLVANGFRQWGKFEKLRQANKRATLAEILKESDKIDV